jgi:hypothetical protein
MERFQMTLADARHVAEKLALLPELLEQAKSCA